MLIGLHDFWRVEPQSGIHEPAAFTKKPFGAWIVKPVCVALLPLEQLLHGESC